MMSSFQFRRCQLESSLAFVIFVLVIQSSIIVVNGQSCAGIGQVCGRTSDCCRGCCENYQCVDRSYCTNDLGLAAGIGGVGIGAGGCQGFYCPPGQMCYLAQICPPGTACAAQPMCRPYSGYGGGFFWRNSAQMSSTPVYTLIAMGLLTAITLNRNLCI